ncbi:MULTISPECIES: DUF3168 domain-containing protein [Bacillaceae]|uniref:DUF3168 domain-containing protein n=1 Tax=Evansella alkalicola TaxID=745819 RepID=A0ABS6K2H6_9BACI|nr:MULTISPECIES: DUF3168 domain-containing protein [Bacillaceae]MBU9724125.1 DUF3168 domain-containing protein [Bacillus alkalicola]
MKMIKIRKDIKAFLKSYHPRIHHENAPDDAEYPFVVYNFPNSVDDGSLENFVLELDIWDNKADTTEMETIIGSIDKALHRRTVAIGDLSMSFYRENRLVITDPDKRLRRRQYVYQVRTYGE